MYFINVDITASADKYANRDPKSISIHWWDVKPPPNLRIFKVVAPNMVGTARKKENSLETVLEAPVSIPPMIVAADLDVPGIMARH